MGLVRSPKECLMCLNSSETMYVPTEESQKIFNICCSYVKDAINIEFLISNIIGNNSKLSFCKNCFQSSLNISQLVEQLSNLKKEIDDMARCFSENIAKQRIQSKVNSSMSQFENENTTFNIGNNHRANPEPSDRCAIQILREKRDSFILSDSEARDKLLVKEIAFDKISCENVKIERDDHIFLDCEDQNFTDNVIGHNREDYEGSYSLTTGHENEVGPLGAIELEQTPGIVNNCNIINESMSRTSKSHSEFVSCFSMASNVPIRIQNEVPSNTNVTFNSTKTYKSKPQVNYNKIIPGGSGSSCTSATEITNLKHKTMEKRRQEYKHICPICEKRFHTPIKLKRHYLIHTGEKPYNCSVCEKAFRQSSHLQRHERLHTGETPYKCSICKAAFKHINSLKDHERIHTGETH